MLPYDFLVSQLPRHKLSIDLYFCYSIRGQVLTMISCSGCIAIGWQTSHTASCCSCKQWCTQCYNRYPRLDRSLKFSASVTANGHRSAFHGCCHITSGTIHPPSRLCVQATGTLCPFRHHSIQDLCQKAWSRLDCYSHICCQKALLTWILQTIFHPSSTLVGCIT